MLIGEACSADHTNEKAPPGYPERRLLQGAVLEEKSEPAPARKGDHSPNVKVFIIILKTCSRPQKLKA
jgi:hypothetical protein